MRLIDLEAHFITPEFADCTNSGAKERMGPAYDQLVDLGDGRLKEMDEAGIDIQVLSLFQPPNIQSMEPAAAAILARSANEALSAAVRENPDRLVGLAALPAQSPDEATAELERAVLKLGLRGACLMSNAMGEYFDDPKYWGIFETAQKLDVPLYLHPTTPSPVIAGAYAGFEMLSGPPHGLSTEVSLHVMRLIFSGLFDRYPGLKMILGHMGEGLPNMIPRLDFFWLREGMARPDIEKKPSEYLQRNFTVTTSGMFFQPALISAYLALGAGNIAFAVDYPPEHNHLAVEFIEAAPICDSDKERICHLNAEALFNL